jgi:hypothetical protein
MPKSLGHAGIENTGIQNESSEGRITFCKRSPGIPLLCATAGLMRLFEAIVATGLAAPVD